MSKHPFAGKGSMVDSLREELQRMGKTALELSERLGSMGEKISRQQREVAVAAIDMRIKSIMQEATYFALNDMFSEIEHIPESIIPWMEMKREL